MRAMQSSTALVEKLDSVELWSKEQSGSYAALQFVSRRLDLGIVDYDQTGDVERVDVRKDAAVPRATVPGVFESPDSRDKNRFPWTQSPAGVAEGAGLAHDAGNLLGALSLYSELLAAPGVLHEEYSEYAADLRLLSERSSAMIARLMERENTLKAKDSCAMTILPDVAARCRGLLSRIAGRRVEMTFGFGSDRPVNISAEVVERILTNLVKNAAEAIDEERGSISVHITAAGDPGDRVGPRVVMTVSDTGRGMSHAAVGSLGESTAPGTGGRGLGFRVVRELAAMSDGCLAVSSEQGNGTSVSVEWRAIEQIEMEARGEGTRRVLRGEAGWIAC